MPAQEDFQKYLNELTSSSTTSMKTLLNNPLVKDIFFIEHDGDDEFLTCSACNCTNNTVGKLSRKHRFPLEDGSCYSTWETGTKKPMTKFFSNF